MPILKKIEAERNDRNKSSYVWFDDEDKEHGRIKLEIGSSINPEPYEKRKLKTYIQEYLESIGLKDVVFEYQLTEVEINVLCIERTFRNSGCHLSLNLMRIEVSIALLI